MTKVIFRKFKDQGDLIALFPNEIFNNNGDITSYQTIGQHGAADYNHCINITVPAKPEEYASLLAELKRQGYDDLKIMKRKGKFNMKKYDAAKISHKFTNLDYAKQFFPEAVFIDSPESYDLGNGYSIAWVESELFYVDYNYYDHSVGYVTDDDIFGGNFGECIDFVLKQTGKG